MKIELQEEESILKITTELDCDYAYLSRIIECLKLHGFNCHKFCDGEKIELMIPLEFKIEPTAPPK